MQAASREQRDREDLRYVLVGRSVGGGWKTAARAYKTKGHRVIAMPLCSTGLAPPAFTAPCRNQTSDCAPLRGKRCARRFFEEIRRYADVAGAAAHDCVAVLTKPSNRPADDPPFQRAQGAA